jgi:hypothetical protein
MSDCHGTFSFVIISRFGEGKISVENHLNLGTNHLKYTFKMITKKILTEDTDSHSLTVFSVHLQCIFKVNGLFVEVMIVYRSSKKMFLLSGST